MTLVTFVTFVSKTSYARDPSDSPEMKKEIT